jgi:hypothetical protein
MAWCQNCEQPYDEDNDTQPCCGGCGFPITCDGPDYEIFDTCSYREITCDLYDDPDFNLDEMIFGDNLDAYQDDW